MLLYFHTNRYQIDKLLCYHLDKLVVIQNTLNDRQQTVHFLKAVSELWTNTNFVPLKQVPFRRIVSKIKAYLALLRP